MKFRDYFDQWKSDCCSNMSEDWFYTVCKLAEYHIIPHIGDIFINLIKPAHISKVLDASKKKGHSDKTRLHLYSILRKIFLDANDFHELELKNPVKWEYHRPKLKKKKANFLTPDQATIVLEYVLHSRYSHAIWIQMLCGLRVSEVLPLRWGDVDFKNNMIKITKIITQKGKEKKYTKGGNQVYVPMPARLKKYLLKHQKHASSLVMPNQKNKPMCYFVYRRYLRKIAKALNIPVRSSHGLRHSCTEIWVSQGASAEDLRRLLNHESLSTIENYIHRTDDRLNRLAKKIA